MNDNLIKYKCLYCSDEYSNKLNEKLKQWFGKIFKVSATGINKFILLLRKGAYPDEYMDDLKKFNETALLEKEEFYSNMNMEDITDAYYMDARRVCKDIEIKNVGKYRDLYLKCETLLPADGFENFRKLCFKIYHLDPVKFISSPGLLWQAALGNVAKASSK